MRKDIPKRRCQNEVKRLRYIVDALPDNIDGLRILDCGCSYGYIAFMLRSCFDGIPVITGVDKWGPLKDFHKKMKLYNNIIICDLVDFVNEFRNERKYNYIFMGDVIEHLKKEDSLRVLEKLKDMVKNKIIVNVPLEYLIALPDGHESFRGNPHQKHESEWSRSDLENVGFSCIVYDIREMTRLTMFFDSIRRFVFGIKSNTRYMVATWAPRRWEVSKNENV